MEDSSRLGRGGVYTSPHHNAHGREVLRGMAGSLPALSFSWGTEYSHFRSASRAVLLKSVHN